MDENSKATQHQLARERWIAIAALIGVNAVWGFSFPLMKSMNLQIDDYFQTTSETASTALRVASAAWIIALRFILALAGLAIVASGLFRRASKAECIAGAWIAVFLYVGLVLQVVGLATIPASRSGFLTSLTTVFAPLFAWGVLRRRPSIGIGIGVVLALFGAAVLTGVVHCTMQGISIATDAGQAWQLGDTLTTLAAMFFTGQVLLIDYYGTQAKMNSVAFTPSMFVTLAVLGILTFLVVSPIVPEQSAKGWIGIATDPKFFSFLIVTGVFCSLISFVGMNKYQPYITAVQASVIYTLEPVFASSWALFLPGWISVVTGILYVDEVLTSPLLIGGGLIIAANIIALWPARTPSNETPKPKTV
jgi:drug/metabolite transporter (DMT)-like permease